MFDVDIRKKCPVIREVVMDKPKKAVGPEVSGDAVAMKRIKDYRVVSMRI